MSEKYERPERRPAVVTGASSGIGAAIALRLGTAGYPVALGARRTDRLNDVAEKIRAEGGEAVVHPLDLTDDSSVTTFAKAVTADLGDVEVVVSNAGAVAPGRIVEVDPERFTRELDLTVVGAHRLVRAFVPEMVGAAARRRRVRVVGLRGTAAAVHGRLLRRQVGAGGHGRLAAAGARGHRRPRQRGAARPHLERDGRRLGGRRRRLRADQWAHFGLARHPHFLKPMAVADAIATVVDAPRGVHLNLVEVTPEAPVADS